MSRVPVSPLPTGSNPSPQEVLHTSTPLFHHPLHASIPSIPLIADPTSLKTLITLNQDLKSLGPPFMGPRSRLTDWETLGADKIVLQAIKVGVRLNLQQLPPPTPHAPCLSPALEDQMQEYIAMGVARPLTLLESQNTRCWVHTFGREKPHSPKVRIITNLKPLNQCYALDRFKGDHWGTVLQTLQDHPHCRWGVTLDLKDWFFHLGLHPQTQRWVRVRGHNQSVQMLGLPFGLQSSPFWAHRLAKPMLQHLRGRGTVMCWYVDDILLLGESPAHVFSQLTYFIQLLTRLGIRINFPKCHLTPSQTLPYLGQTLNLAQRSISCVPLKAQGCRWMAKKLCSGNTTRPCNLASLAGKLLDLQKGAVNLVGLARQLMHHAGTLSRWGWYKVIKKPLSLSALLTLTRAALQHLTPTQLPHPGMTCLTLCVDACQTGWGEPYRILRGPFYTRLTNFLPRWRGSPT